MTMIFRPILLTVLAALTLFVADVSATSMTPIAEAAWIEHDGSENQLRIGYYDGESWGQHSKPVYRTRNAITAPTMGTSHDGIKTILWTEQRRSKFILMSIEGRFDNQTEEYLWSEPTIFSSFGIENFGASLIYDLNGLAWVVWSASTGDLSDVYLSKQQAFGWSKPERINDVNDVPDNQPELSLDADGNLLVSWNTYDFDLGSYIRTSELIITNEPKPNQNQQTIVDSVDSKTIPAPAFLPYNSVAVVHYPNNIRIQAERISQ